MAEFRQGMKLLGDELDGATVSLGGGGRGALSREWGALWAAAWAAGWLPWLS